MDKSEIFYKRPGTTDKGRDYENIVVAKTVLQLVNDDRIKDFHISSNDKKFGAFDDIVVKIESESGIKVQALQLKHSDRKILSLENLKSKKGDYSIRKYFESFQKIRNLVDEFVLFTNRLFNVDDDTKFQLEGEAFLLEPVKVNDALELSSTVNYAYKFQIVEDSSSVNDIGRIREYETFLNKFYLCSDQENLHAFKNTTRNEFKKTYCSNDDTFYKFYRIIAEWMVQEGKKEKLNKYWMKRMIALQILSSQIEPLSFGTVNEKMKIFRECISMFDVTLFGKESCRMVKHLWGDIEKENIDFQELNRVARKYQLANYYIDDSNFDKLNPRVFAQLLWLMNKCPLILHDNENTTNAIQLCPSKNFILFGESMKKEIKNCSVFRDLSNLQHQPDMFDKVIKNFTISIQGKKELNLMTVFENNYDFLQDVSTDNLLEMLNGPCCIGGKKETLPDPYVERTLSQNVFDITYLEKKHENTIIILNSANSFDKVKEKLSKCKIIDVKNFKKKVINVESRVKSEFDEINLTYDQNYFESVIDKLEFTNTVYVSSEDVDDFILQEIFSKNIEIKNVHYFKVLNEKYIQWVKSKGDISNLEEFKISNIHFIDEGEFWPSRLKNNINLVTGDPGMGKSELMKSYKNSCAPNYWTIIINPRDCNLYFTKSKLPVKSKHTNSFTKFLKKEKCGSMNKLDQIFFEMCTRQNYVVFVWDAFDEILNEYLDVSSSLILDFAEKGVLQWVTSRQHLRRLLEAKFCVLSFRMSQFSEQEQEYYIRKRLDSFISVEQINKTVEKIKFTFVIVEHVNILGIPLQTFMLTELFRQNNDKYLKLLEDSFLLTDLYHHFIEEKFYIFYKDKIDFDLRNPHLRIRMNKEKQKALKHYEKLALCVTFPEEIELRLCIDRRKHMHKVLDKYAPIGLLYEFQNNVLQFLHSSFAEYLVATYFSRNFGDIPKDIIFAARYNNIRFFFDMMMAKNSSAHIAVLYRKFASLEEYDDETLRRKDLGGRSVLHVTCSWGQRHPRLPILCTSGNYIVVDKNSNNKPETKDYFDAVLHLQDKNDPDERDTMLDLTPLSYARKSESLGAELKLLQRKGLELNQICTSTDRINILYYSILLGYEEVSKLFTVQNSDDLHKEVKFVTTKLSQTSLLLACEKGNLGIVKYVVESGAELNKMDCYTRTPLNVASYKGDEEIVEYLVDSGADVNHTTYLGSTSLHMASQNGHEKIVQYLAEKGVDVNRPMNDSLTPLHCASVGGHEKSVECLVAASAEIDGTSKNNRTALHFASENGHDVTIEYLVKNGADVNHQDENGVVPLHLASLQGHEKSIECLVQAGADVNRASSKGFTALHLASQYGHVKVVGYLIKNGADVNCVDKEDWTPLQAAAMDGHTETVACLMETGATVDSTNIDKRTALHLASLNGHLTTVEHLVTGGAHINQRDKHGLTPLHLAAFNGCKETVHYLVKNGGEINSPENSGRTPLHLASQNGHLNVVQYLVQTGADVNHSDNNGLTPLYFAALNEQEDFVDCLMKAGADVNHIDKNGWTPLHVASQQGREKVVQYLVRAGADINCVNDNGWTPLHVVSEKGHETIAAFLVRAGCDINRTKSNGWTSLHLASQNRHGKIVQCLVNAGAKLDLRDKEGWTPLHLAAQYGHEDVFKRLVKADAEINCSDNGCPPLFLASQNGHKEIVQRLVEAGVDVNSTTEDGGTALHVAAENGHTNVVQYLMTTGADINQKSKNGWTPIHLASKNGHEEIVQSLVEAGAKVDDIDEKGWTPLHIASQYGQEHVVRTLVTVGADINCMCSEGSTPLIHAARTGHDATVDFLVEIGAKLNLAQNDGRTPLHLAAAWGHEKTVERLVNSGSDLNRQDNNGITPLHLAAIKGHQNVVEYLWSVGVDINCANENGWTPLHLAAEKGHENVVNVLVKIGGDINRANNNGCTPLHVASQNGHGKTVECLVNAGAEVDPRDRGRWTPLHLAVQQGHKDAVECLVTAGALINCASGDGFSPLHLASQNGHEEICQYLVEAGADVNGTNNSGWTPLHVALHKGHQNIVQYLMTTGVDINRASKNGWTPLHLASKEGHDKAVQSLVEAGVEVDCRDEEGWTPLHLASQCGHEHIVESLTKAGADINRASHDGYTPLHCASQNGHQATIDFLLEVGADINLAINDGRTPLHLAAVWGHQKTVERLVSSGSDVNRQDHHGLTPIHLASMKGHESIVEYLVTVGGHIHAANNCNDWTPLHLASGGGHVRSVECLVKAGCEVNRRDKNGMTPLCLASMNGGKDTVECLVEAGADVNGVNKDGWAPLHFASVKGHEGIVECLVNCGAEIGCTTNSGHTPLDLAIISRHENIVDLLKCVVLSMDAG